MPALEHKEKVNQFVTIGVQYKHGGYKTLDIANKGKWSARIKYPNRKPIIRSLGIPYKNGSDFNKRLAVEAAEKLALELYEKARHIDPSEPTSFRLLATQWINEAEVKAEANENLLAKGLPAQHEVKGGRGYWTPILVKQNEILLRKYILPFFKTLDRGWNEADVTTIRPQELDGITEWIFNNPSPEMIKKGRPVSPSLVLKAITVVRHVYRYAYEKNIVSQIPQIQRPKRQLKERVRREITDKEYEIMVAWTRNKYQDDSYLGEVQYKDLDGVIWREKVTTYRDYQYLFHLFLLILANCGIRPPTGNTPNTWIKWSHYSHDKKTGITTLHRPDEKNHDYKALILKSAVPYWEALRKFQKDRKMYHPDGYVFAHPYTFDKKKGGWKKGDPIKSFAGQWRRMCKELNELYPDSGFNCENGVPQSQRITPSSLRSFFITKRLQEGDANIEKLAFATGTNHDVIMEHYFKFATEKEYDKLTKGTYTRAANLVPEYNENGYYIGHKQAEEE